MKKKFLAFLLTTCLAVGVMAPVVKVEAKTVTLSTSKPTSCDFKKAWERTKLVYCYDNVYVGELCYGYNTFAINEDYTWTRSGVYTHKSGVTDNKGTTIYSSAKKASTSAKWAKIEIAHKGSSHKYKIQFTNVSSSEGTKDFKLGKETVSTNK